MAHHIEINEVFSITQYRTIKFQSVRPHKPSHANTGGFTPLCIFCERSPTLFFVAKRLGRLWSASSGQNVLFRRRVRRGGEQDKDHPEVKEDLMMTTGKRSLVIKSLPTGWLSIRHQSNLDINKRVRNFKQEILKL